MARIFNEPKSQHQLDGRFETTLRRSPLQMVPCLVPVQPHNRVYPPRRRLEIAIEVKPDFEMPSPVKIIHTVQD